MKKNILILILVLIVSGCANRFFYYPTQNTYSIPDKKKYSYEDISFKSKDGASLHGWFFKSGKKSKGTIIYFHGNSQNISAHFSFVSWLPKKGYNLFMFDYRGYGKSEGKPFRKGLYKDCTAALEYIFSRQDIDNNRIFLLGQSLGGAYALAVMKEDISKKLKGAAIDSAFYSYREIVKDKIAVVPVVSLLKTPLSYICVSNDLSPEYILENVKIPVIVFHGTCDKVVPFRHGKMIYKGLPEPKKFIEIPGGNHVEGFIRKEEKYRDILVNFIEDCFSK